MRLPVSWPLTPASHTEESGHMTICEQSVVAPQPAYTPLLQNDCGEEHGSRQVRRRTRQTGVSDLRVGHGIPPSESKCHIQPDGRLGSSRVAPWRMIITLQCTCPWIGTIRKSIPKMSRRCMRQADKCKIVAVCAFGKPSPYILPSTLQQSLYVQDMRSRRQDAHSCVQGVFSEPYPGPPCHPSVVCDGHRPSCAGVMTVDWNRGCLSQLCIEETGKEVAMAPLFRRQALVNLPANTHYGQPQLTNSPKCFLCTRPVPCM